jgi:methylglutamate dehydrogenase subunit B
LRIINVRIACPYCGERGNDEFSYLGDASLIARPDAAGAHPLQAFADYVYQRENPRGTHRELWYHAAGCHSWLVVTRDTMRHEITRVEFAKDVAAGPAPNPEAGV